MPEEQQLREEGNELFKSGKYEEAICKYTKGLEITEKAADRAVFYRNRAACYLKLGKPELVVKDASAALDVVPSDAKSLFRRCQAYEQIGKYSEAFKDGKKLLHFEPNNKAIQPIMRSLTEKLQAKSIEQQSPDNKVSQMFRLAMDLTEDKEKRVQAANNIIVLAREESGAEKIFRNNGVMMIVMLLNGKDTDLRLAATRILACMVKNSKQRAVSIYETVTLQKMALLMAMDDEEISNAAAHLLQNIIIWVANIENLKAERDRYEYARKKNIGSKARPYGFVSDRIDAEAYEIVDPIFEALVQMLNSGKVSKYGRDNAMELIIKLGTRKEGIGWSLKFIEAKGVQKLMEVAGTLTEHKTLPITENSRAHASVALEKIYDDLLSDKERSSYREAVDEYFQDVFGDDIMESKIEAIMAISALLQGPFEVGNSVLGRQGVMELMIALADSANPLHIKVAVEALVHSASKKDKCSGIIKQATPILKKLYQSQTDAIKVRALVGLCKLGSFGGHDASSKAFADGSTQTLFKACRKFLTNPAKDIDLRKWATEGLAYLSLDADVKEELCADAEALKTLMDLSKKMDVASLYPVAQVFVNLTNSYDDPKPDPEMVELAKFAKQHVPTAHDKDAPEYVKERVRRLVEAGIVSAVVALAKTESDSCKENLARVLLAVAMEQEHRGILVQQGGVKVLIPLALHGNPLGTAIAAQALAKVAITTNPDIAFPGQRSCEVVRPLLLLLHPDKTALQNFEALMALTNLASSSDTVRKRIHKEKGLPSIFHYMFEDHEMLRRAATECICNMVMCDDVVEVFKGENDNLKLLVLYCGEEDEKLVRAAAGAVAMLSHEEVICKKIITSSSQWMTILQGICVHEQLDIQHRAVYILMNMMASCKEVAEKLVESSMLEILMALSKLQEPAKASIKDCAEKALDFAVKWELIKPTDDSS